MADTCKTCEYIDTKEYWGAKDGYCEWHNMYVYQSDTACGSYRAASRCYITTIVHDILKKDDKCEVLQTLRKWRNETLSQKEEYKKVLMEYDTIGPVVADYLKRDQDTELCKLLYDNYLQPVCEKVQKNDEKGAITRYKDMIRHIKFYYGIEKNVEIKAYNQEKGGHGKIYRK